MKPDQERVRNLLTDTVTLLCKNGLQYQTELRVQGVLGITLDNNDVFIVHINEKFGDAIGGALTIRNDEGDAAKTLLGGTRLDTRKSHDASRGDTPIAVNSKTGEVVHRRRRRSRESSASPALPTTNSQKHILQRPIKRLMPSNKDTLSDIGRNRSSLHDSAGNDSVMTSSTELEVKVKTEVDDVIVLGQDPENRTEIGGASQNIPHTTDQSAMQESYPDLSLSELQGSYQPFGEILGVTDGSTNSGADGTAPPPTKRRVTNCSSEMAPSSDAGGPFITGMVQNESTPGDVVPQTTTATSWDPSQLPDFGTLTARDSQMILDSTPGCSTWDTSQQSQVSAMTTPTSHTIQNTSDQSSESVWSGAPAGQAYKGGKYAELMDQLITDINTNLHEHSADSQHKCDRCDMMFKGKAQLKTHMRNKHMGRRFACPQCHLLFVSFGRLNEHAKYVHQKRPRYQCETCGKGFINRLHYLDHLATHTGSKRHVCSVCQSQFTFKPSLKRHVLHFHPDEAAQLL